MYAFTFHSFNHFYVYSFMCLLLSFLPVFFFRNEEIRQWIAIHKFRNV